MALFLLQEGVQPIGDFDVLNTDALLIKGGELMCLDVATKGSFDGNTTTEQAAQDVFDAYVSSGTKRVVARIADNSSADDGYMMYLADEGTRYYGVMFGTIIGSPVGIGTSFANGQINSAGVNLGPSSLTGSGKVTCWDKPGMYGVSLDAVSSAFVVD